MQEADVAAIAHFLNDTIDASRLNLRFTITPWSPEKDPEKHPEKHLERREQVPCLAVHFTGTDVPALLHRNGELLLALEHLATQVLRLAPEQHDLVSFDAGGFKDQRNRALERAAAQAIREVRASSRPFHFPPMSSRERRLLHLALATSGLPTVSEGDPPRRHLVLHPGPR